MDTFKEKVMVGHLNGKPTKIPLYQVHEYINGLIVSKLPLSEKMEHMGVIERSLAAGSYPISDVEIISKIHKSIAAFRRQ
jgi:hypothetical protein